MEALDSFRHLIGKIPEEKIAEMASVTVEQVYQYALANIDEIDKDEPDDDDDGTGQPPALPAEPLNAADLIPSFEPEEFRPTPRSRPVNLPPRPDADKTIQLLRTVTVGQHIFPVSVYRGKMADRVISLVDPSNYVLL